MSYPWYRFEVTFQDGHSTQFTATGLGVTDALRTLLEQGDLDFANDPLVTACFEHGDVVAVKFLHYDTFGIDPESDAILLKEQADAGPDVYWCGGCGQPDCGFCRTTQEPPRRDRLQVGDFGE